MKLIKLLAGACAALTFSFCSAAAVPFTAATAPDSPSRIVLSKTITHLWGNVPEGGDKLAGIHANFSQVVEQNFARLDAIHATLVVDRLSEKELADLAQLYVSANADSGHRAQLLAVLATRLDVAHLMRLSHHFGYVALQEALINNASAKASLFSAAANVSELAPVPHAPTVGTARLSVGGIRPNAGGIGQFANLTPYETYLSLRTAPVGSLGVQGALLETTFIWGGMAYGSWSAGTAIGDKLAPVIETYSPTTWDAIGGTLSEMYDNYRRSIGEVKKGELQKGIGELFGASTSQVEDFETMGGDYEATSDWEAYASSGSGGGCGVRFCPEPPPTGA